MSTEEKVISSVRDTPEPHADAAPVPVWLFVLLIVLVFCAMFYFDQRSGWFNPQVYAPYKSFAQLQSYQPPTGGIDLQRGRAVYEAVCALCHGSDGAGKPNQAPTFIGSDWVTGSPGRLIRIPLAGLTGPIEVNGEQWNLAMPAMGAALSDDDLAAVLTYMRQSWGNNAEEITVDQVQAVRAEVGNRGPYTAQELQGL